MSIEEKYREVFGNSGLIETDGLIQDAKYPSCVWTKKPYVINPNFTSHPEVGFYFYLDCELREFFEAVDLDGRIDHMQGEASLEYLIDDFIAGFENQYGEFVPDEEDIEGIRKWMDALYAQAKKLDDLLNEM